MPAPQKTYEELEQYDKIKLINAALDLLIYKPSLIGDVKTDEEFLDRLEKFAKTLYERFPKFERKGTIGSAKLSGV
jgi:hypothetical protein